MLNVSRLSMLSSASELKCCLRLLAKLTRAASSSSSSNLIGEQKNLYQSESIVGQVDEQHKRFTVEQQELYKKKQAAQQLKQEQQHRQEPSNIHDDDYGFQESITQSYSTNYADLDHFEVQRGLPRSKEEFLERKRLPINQPDDPRLLKVAIMGMPNAGKSTLTNKLVGSRISAVSSKVHTTRLNTIGVMVEGQTQVEFWDTPGLVMSKHLMKHSLEASFITAPKASARYADLVMIVVDASNKRDRSKLNDGILKVLDDHQDKEAILVLNKIDMLKKKRRLVDFATQLTDGVVDGVKSVEGKSRIMPTSDNDRIEMKLNRVETRLRNKGVLMELEPEVNQDNLFTELPLTPEITDLALAASNQETDDIDKDLEDERIGWPHFTRVFMVSALTGDGIEGLRSFLISKGQPSGWKYHGSLVSPQPPQRIVIDMVKEKILDILPQEVPYLITYTIDSWAITRVGTLIVSIVLRVPKDRYMPMLLGPGGAIISRIANEARQTIADTFECDVSLKLIAKCTEVKTKKWFKRN